jgi:phenylalanine-4-hydroxylase
MALATARLQARAPIGRSIRAGRLFPAEHDVWITLYERQADMLHGRACDAFLRGLDALDLHRTGIPDFHRINEELQRLTGWSVVAVPGLVPDDVFFDHLANRRFPAGQFIRKPHELDYLQEPDIFHDVFGHVPMLTDPTFADYMQAYGQGGQRALGRGSPGQSGPALLVHGRVRPDEHA